MTQQTGYHSWTRPVPHETSNEDDDDWAGILEKWCEDEVEEAVIKRGTKNNRPAAGSSTNPDEPRLYLSEDTNPYPELALDSGVGTGWTRINPTTVQRASKTFGGMVNGDHSDFSTAQDAIDFGDMNGYKMVVFPEGIFGAITIPEGMSVTGTGIRLGASTQFEDTVTGGGVVTLNQNSLLERCVVRNMGTGTGDHAVVGGYRATANSVNLHTAGGDGFNSGDANEIHITGCVANLSNIGGASCNLTANSSNCIVTSNRNFGSVTNSGTGNVVANNT